VFIIGALSRDFFDFFVGLNTPNHIYGPDSRTEAVSIRPTYSKKIKFPDTVEYVKIELFVDLPSEYVAAKNTKPPPFVGLMIFERTGSG
jgi:hypothetical protein